MFNQINDNLEERGFIDKNKILKYVSEQQIFSLVFGFEPVEYQYVLSPFRKDRNPNCWFQYYPSGKLKFVDFASEIYISGRKMINIDCFDAIKYYYKLNNLYNVLEFIYKKLILGKNLDSIKTDNKSFVKKDFKIYFEARDFDFRDKIFWQKYQISRQNLIDDKVFPVKKFKLLNTKKGTITTYPTTICYAYTDFTDNKIKLYLPFNKKHKRFITNCGSNDIGSINKLPKFGTNLIITKSYKDYRVLKNQGCNVIWNQNEGMIPNDSIIIDLCKRFTYIHIFYDNDSVGIENSDKYVNIINAICPGKCSSVIIPTIYIKENIKDISDFIEKKGRKTLIEFLNKNKLL